MLYYDFCLHSASAALMTARRAATRPRQRMMWLMLLPMRSRRRYMAAATRASARGRSFQGQLPTHLLEATPDDDDASLRQPHFDGVRATAYHAARTLDFSRLHSADLFCCHFDTHFLQRSR